MDKKRLSGLILFTLLSLGCYIWLGYGTLRPDFLQLISLYAFLFALYILALKFKILKLKLWQILAAAMVLRLSFILLIPNLSDDFYRYIWDGLLWAGGYNPYLSFPVEFAGNLSAIPHMTTAIYQGLNSPDYYTVYPPFLQMVFGLGATIAGGNILTSIVIYRLFILLAEAGTIILIYAIAPRLNVTSDTASLYAFNPLVIIELSGNLHFEALMLFFLTLSLYLAVRSNIFSSAASFGLSVSTKLVPLIFLPLLIRRLKIKRSLAYFAIIAASFFLLVTPFLNSGLWDRIGSLFVLYFQKFEFNASFYYLFRWIGFQVTGYDTIAVLGPALAVVTFFLVIFITAREKNAGWKSFMQNALFCMTIYYLLATTVHPWYIITILLLGCFSSYRYPVAWSGAIILSYSAYQSRPYAENYWLIALEYSILAGWIIYEFLIKPRLKSRQ